MEDTYIIIIGVVLLILAFFVLDKLVKKGLKNEEPRNFEFIEFPKLAEKLYKEIKNKFVSDYILIEGNKEDYSVTFYKDKHKNIKTINFKFIKAMIIDINISELPRLFFDKKDVDRLGEDALYEIVLDIIKKNRN